MTHYYTADSQREQERHCFSNPKLEWPPDSFPRIQLARQITWQIRVPQQWDWEILLLRAWSSVRWQDKRHGCGRSRSFNLPQHHPKGMWGGNDYQIRGCLGASFSFRNQATSPSLLSSGQRVDKVCYGHAVSLPLAIESKTIVNSSLSL